MKMWVRKKLAILLSFAMILSMAIPGTVSQGAKKKVKITKKLTLTVGEKEKVKISTKKKIKKTTWKLTKKGKKIVKLSKRKKKSAVVKGKKKGTATLTAKVKIGKKTYKLKTKISVVKRGTTPLDNASPKVTSTPDTNGKVDVTKSPEMTSTPTSGTAGEATPTPTLEAGGAVTNSPTVTSTPTPIPTPTPTPAPTKVPGTPIPVTDTSKALDIDFEDGKNLYVTGRQGEETLTVTSGGYDDNYCLKVSNRVKNWAGPIINVTHNVESFTAYTIEAYVKHTTGGNKTINCMWQVKDYYGTESYKIVKQQVVPTGNWYKIEATVVSPGDLTELHMYFEMENYSNDFYVDNISITKKVMDTTQVLAADSLQSVFSKRFAMGCSAYTYHLQNPDIAAFIKHHYSTITYGDELKPESVLVEEESKAAEDGMPKINKNIIDKCLRLAKENNLKVRFHTLIWYSQTPDWFFCENYIPEYDGKGTAKANITNLVSEEVMLARMQSYISQVITYAETNYPGVVYAYDVVNEVIDGNGCTLRTLEDGSLYGAIFGAEDTTYITKAFQYARTAQTATNSNAKLFYNDYIGMASPGQRKAVVNYLADAKAGGYIDGIGMQAHQTNLSVSDGDNIKNALTHFKDNGYEVQITELDFASKDNSESGNQTLATAYTKFMEILMERMDTYNLSLTNVTLWNLTDLDTWLNSYYNDGNTYYPSLFNENYLPKQAFTSLVEMVKAKDGTSGTGGTIATPTPTPGGGATVTPTPSTTATPTPTPTATPTPTPVPTPVPSSTPKPVVEGEALALDLTEGNIVITENGYSIAGGEEQSYTGKYEISGTANNSVSITGGSHHIVLKNVVSSTTAASPVDLSGDADVILELSGESTLTAPSGYAGVHVPAGCELEIIGTGKLTVTGGAYSAGIGGKSNGSQNGAGTTGRIVIRSGTIIATSASTGAGIGEGIYGNGGALIEIYGGTICAKSGRKAAGIGGGAAVGSSPTSSTILIYGGCISASGGSYEIGDGSGQSSYTVYVYGGTFKSLNNKPLFGTTVPTADSYVGKTVGTSSLSGIQKVTVDGVDQGISSFPLTDSNGTTKAVDLVLYMSAGEAHEVVVTDSAGVEHVISVTAS